MTTGDRLLDVFCTPARLAGLFDAAKGFTLEDWHFEGLTLRRAMGVGDGPIVLVLHGWGSGGQHMFGLARAIARAGARPVIVDFPAHGASGGRTTTMLQCGRVIRALVTQSKPVGICAHSFGAMAAAMVCGGHAYFGGIRHPHLKLAMVSPGYSLEVSLQRHCADNALDAQQGAALRSAIAQRFDIDVPRFHLETIAAQLPARACVFHDQDDAVIALEQIRRILKAAPHVPLTVTQGNGHDKILLNRAVLRQVGAFFKVEDRHIQ